MANLGVYKAAAEIMFQCLSTTPRDLSDLEGRPPPDDLCSRMDKMTAGTRS
jgi:hypothetical protein